MREKDHGRVRKKRGKSSLTALLAPPYIEVKLHVRLMDDGKRTADRFMVAERLKSQLH